ncbi:MAG: COX15/CtaA family protein [Candidatus Acidiferrales bacterium]
MMSPNQAQSSRGLYRFAVATSWCTVLLLMAGALVTNNNAGDSVPDWPLAYGRAIPPFVDGIRFEYAHRVIAGLVAVLTLILAVWVVRAERRPVARHLSWSAFALVIAQAALGGFRVLAGYPDLSATAHATVAQIFFVMLVGLSIYLSPWWQSDQPQLDDSGAPPARYLTVWTTAAILVQIVLGAAFRHGALGIVPHLVGAGVVTTLVVWTGRAVKNRFRQDRDLRRGVALLHSFFGIQLLLGGAAWWEMRQVWDAVQSAPLYVLLTVAHVLGGALTLASSVLLTMYCFRLIRPAAALAAGSPVGSSSKGSPQQAGV